MKITILYSKTPIEAHCLGKLLNHTKSRNPVMCLATVTQQAQYVLLFLILVVNST